MRLTATDKLLIRGVLFQHYDHLKQDLEDNPPAMSNLDALKARIESLEYIEKLAEKFNVTDSRAAAT